MLKKICILFLTIGFIAHGCPMGLGKNYQDKPPFFHPTFYIHKKFEQKKWFPMSCKAHNKNPSRKIS